MHEAVIGFVAGLICGVYLGALFGQARARALRAWRDFIATRNTITGLFRRTFREWATAVKFGFIVAVVVFGGLCLLVFGGGS